MKPIYLLSPVLAALLLTTGCKKNEDLQAAGTAINVRVSTVDTKSSAITTNDLQVAGKFVLDAYVVDDYDAYSPSGEPLGHRSAGPYITSNGLYNVFFSSSSFPDTGRDDVTEDWYIKDGSGNEPYNWIPGNKTRFWCRYPADADVASAAKGIRTITSAPTKDSESMTFTYALPTASSSAPYSDATNQKDLLFAYAERTFTGGSDDIDIKFNHPLSKICFCVSPNDGSFDTNLTVQDISISGVPNSGTCVFNGKGQITKDGSNPMFVWSGQTGTAAYKQTYNVSFSGSGAPAGWDDNNRYKSNSDLTDYNVYYAESDTGKEHPFKKYTCENAFMMIPHTLNGAKLNVTFGNTGTGNDITVSVNLPNDTWYAGYYYNYKISATTIGRTIKVGVSLVEWVNYDDKLFF